MTAAITLAGKTRGGSAARWAACTMVAVAAHVGAAAGLAGLSVHVEPTPAPLSLVMLELEPLPVPVAPPPPPPQPVELQPPPEPEPELKLEPEPVPPPKPVVMLPKPPPKPKPRPPTPQVQQPEPQPVEPPPATPVAAPVPVPPEPAPRANPDAPQTFQSQLLAHLQRHKRYPVQARSRGQQGVAYLRFTMDRQGKVLACRLERGSGVLALDDEVMALIERAQPLPSPPPEITEQRLEFVVPVSFKLH